MTLLLYGLGFWMDKSKRYLFFQAALSMLTVVALSALGEARVEVYFSLFTVIHFACSALFRPRRKWFDLPGAGMFLGFCYIVAMKVIEIIS